jgi:ABC-type branched-subunit amino acid transport system ATPase component
LELRGTLPKGSNPLDRRTMSTHDPSDPSYRPSVIETDGRDAATSATQPSSPLPRRGNGKVQELRSAGEEMAMARAAEANFFQKGKSNLVTTIKEAANYRELSKTPYGLMPILVLTLLGFIATLDSEILPVALPFIAGDTGIRQTVLIQTLSIASFFLIFISLGLAYIMDRAPRAPFVGVGWIVGGIFSLLTGRVNTEFQLGATRIAEGFGGRLGGTPIASLAADYYPPESRGKVYALNGILVDFAGAVAPLAVGYLVVARTVDPNHPAWRLPFFITGPALIVVGVLALLLLREPIRGYMERKALGASEEVARIPEEPPSFGEAWRHMWSIRTLRRFFIGDIFAGIPLRTTSLYIPFFLVSQYHLDAFGIGKIGAVGGLAAVIGGFWAGGVIDSLTRRRPQRVLIFAGLFTIVGSFNWLLRSIVPPLWVYYAVIAVFGLFSALLGPARGVVYAQILPAHMRTLGLSIRLLAQIPSLIVFFSLIPIIIARMGIAGGLRFTFPFALLTGLVDLSAAGFFERDLRAALASQLATQEFRRAKEAGRGKLLVCRGVDVEYDGIQVLFDVDFDVEEGDVIALLGTNGAGKSTLLKAIAGVQEASGGAIVYDGREITHMPPHEITPRGVVLMPGGRGIFPGLSIRDNLMLGNWMNEDAAAKQRLAEVYRIFPVLKERGGTRAGLLSGGEQQMLSLAQAFLAKPRLLMIDELSLGLSPAMVQQLIEIVKAIHAQGTTIILVEQSVNVALTVAERAIFMEKGEVKFVGKTADLLSRPDILRAVYVKGSGALTASGAHSGVKGDRELRQYELQQARPILQVRDLTKAYGGIKAVNGVSFDLKEGEILGLIGPNGAGKTTIFDLITGYQLPDAGKVFFDGVDITNLPADERARRRLVRRFQDARLFPSLSVYENILVALEQKLEVRSMALTALQVPQVRQGEKRVRRRADRLIELLELAAYRDKFVKELSTGLRRITDLACVLAAEPKVLLLDEPSTGIAQAEAEMLAPLLRRVRFETGASILIIEHDMPLISAISDELIALDQGTFLMRGSSEQVLNDERVIQSYLGTSEEAIQRSGVLE